MKNRACIEWTSGFRECLARSLPAKEPHEKHMLEVKELCQVVSFTSVLWEGPTCEIPVKLSAWRILSVTFLPFTHTIYIIITHKSIRGYSERKTLDRFSTTHTPIFYRESYSFLVRNHCSLFFILLSLSYFERRFVPKHNPHLFRV